MKAVDQRVDERHPLVVDPFDAVCAHEGPFHSDARVRIDVALDVIGDLAGDLSARRDFAFV